MRKKTDPELPLKPPIPFLENYSNGEFFYEQPPRDRLINKLILEKADEKSRKLGVDRRQLFERLSIGVLLGGEPLNLEHFIDDGSLSTRLAAAPASNLLVGDVRLHLAGVAQCVALPQGEGDERVVLTVNEVVAE